MGCKSKGKGSKAGKGVKETVQLEVREKKRDQVLAFITVHPVDLASRTRQITAKRHEAGP